MTQHRTVDNLPPKKPGYSENLGDIVAYLLPGVKFTKLAFGRLIFLTKRLISPNLFVVTAASVISDSLGLFLRTVIRLKTNLKSPFSIVPPTFPSASEIFFFTL
jgi:hypothetical protein